MLTTYGTRPEHFDVAYPFASQHTRGVGFKMGRWTERLADGAAIFVGLALVLPCLLVLFFPLIAALMNCS